MSREKARALGLVEYRITWLSGCDGACRQILPDDCVGLLCYAITEPSSGAEAPAANYDVTLEDRLGLDILNGQLANRSATTSEQEFIRDSLSDAHHGKRIQAGWHELVIAAAEPARSGAVILGIWPEP